MSARQSRFLLLGVAAVLTAGCSSPDPPPAPGAEATVTGRVTRSPTCPGPQRPGQDCVAPVAGATVTASAPALTAVTTTDADGRYRLTIRYTEPVTLLVDPSEAGAMSCETPVVQPARGARIEQDIRCDTGIR